MINIKTPEQIAGIRKACQLAAKCLSEMEQHIYIGQNTEALDQIAREFFSRHNVISATLNYHGFPKSICTSINDVVCHGIPSEKDILKSGDIINVDITLILNGYFGDTSKTFIVGEAAEDVQLFVQRVEKAMYKGIGCLKAGIKLKELGKTIEPYVQKFGYSVVRDYGGHGVGLEFHEEPHIHHYKNALSNITLKPGMIFTVEPMINKSKNHNTTTSKIDGWTVRTKDGSLSGQFEHTVLITSTGFEILTVFDN